jgi:hypothetical protein
MKRCVQLVALLVLAFGVTQLSGLTTSGLARESIGVLSDEGKPREQIASQSEPRATPNATIRVNGRTHPEGVPDEVAFRLYLKSMTLPESPSLEQALRQTAFLKQLGLSAEDESSFTNALGNISLDLALVGEERKLLAKGRPHGAVDDAIPEAAGRPCSG